MITPAEIRERLKQKPFSPLRLRTSVGECYDILKPHFAIIGKQVVVVGIPDTKGDPDEFDRFHLVSLMHLTAMEDVPVPAFVPPSYP